MALLPLDIHSFDKDALILENSQVKEVTLYNKEKKPISVCISTLRWWGCGAPPAKNAPFVCIEPWYGRCDRAIIRANIRIRTGCSTWRRRSL